MSLTVTLLLNMRDFQDIQFNISFWVTSSIGGQLNLVLFGPPNGRNIRKVLAVDFTLAEGIFNK